MESEGLHLFPFGNIWRAYAIRPYSLPDKKIAPNCLFRRTKSKKGEEKRKMPLPRPRNLGRVLPIWPAHRPFER